MDDELQVIVRATLDIDKAKSEKQIEYGIVQIEKTLPKESRTIHVAATLDVVETLKNIQAQLENIVNNTSVQISPIVNVSLKLNDSGQILTVRKNMASLGDEASKASKEVKNINKSLSDLNKIPQNIKEFIPVMGENDIVDLNATITHLKNTYEAFADATFRWVTDTKGNITGLIARVTAADNAVQNLAYTFKNSEDSGTLFSFDYATGSDAGTKKLEQDLKKREAIAKAFKEKMEATIKDVQSAFDSLSNNQKIFDSGNIEVLTTQANEATKAISSLDISSAEGFKKTQIYAESVVKKLKEMATECYNSEKAAKKLQNEVEIAKTKYASTIDILRNAWNDSNSSSFVENKDSLDVLEKEYNDITTAINNMNVESIEGLRLSESSLQSLINKLKQTISHYHNAEKAASQLRVKNFETTKIDTGNDIEKTIAIITNSRVPIEIFNDDIAKLNESFKNLDNVSVNNQKAALTGIMDILDNVKTKFQFLKNLLQNFESPNWLGNNAEQVNKIDDMSAKVVIYQRHLQHLKEEWQSQGIYVGEVAKETASLLQSINNIKKPETLEKWVSDFISLTQNANIFNQRLQEINQILQKQVDVTTQINKLQTQIALTPSNNTNQIETLNKQVLARENELKNLNRQSNLYADIISKEEQKLYITKNTVDSQEKLNQAIAKSSDRAIESDSKAYAKQIDEARKQLDVLAKETSKTLNKDLFDNISSESISGLKNELDGILNTISFISDSLQSGINKTDFSNVISDIQTLTQILDSAVEKTNLLDERTEKANQNLQEQVKSINQINKLQAQITLLSSEDINQAEVLESQRTLEQENLQTLQRQSDLYADIISKEEQRRYIIDNTVDSLNKLKQAEAKSSDRKEKSNIDEYTKDFAQAEKQIASLKSEVLKILDKDLFSNTSSQNVSELENKFEGILTIVNAISERLQYGISNAELDNIISNVGSVSQNFNSAVVETELLNGRMQEANKILQEQVKSVNQIYKINAQIVQLDENNAEQRAILESQRALEQERQNQLQNQASQYADIISKEEQRRYIIDNTVDSLNKLKQAEAKSSDSGIKEYTRQFSQAEKQVISLEKRLRSLLSTKFFDNTSNENVLTLKTNIEQLLNSVTAIGNRLEFGIGEADLSNITSEVKSLTQDINSAVVATKELGANMRQDNAALKNAQQVQILTNQINTFRAANTLAEKEYGSAFNTLLQKLRTCSAEELPAVRREFQILRTTIVSTGKSGKTLFEALRAQAAKFTQWFSITTVIMSAIHDVKKMIDNIVELDNVLLELSKVSDLTANGLKNATKQAYDLGEQVAKTGTQVLTAATNFKRAGFDIEESFNLGAKALVMTNIAENITDAGEAATDLISIMKGYADTSPEFADRILDAVNEVSNTQAINFDELIDGSQRLAAVAQQAGLSFEQMLGIITGANEILQNVEKSSSGAITIFTRLQSIQLPDEEDVLPVAKLQETINTATKGAVDIIDQTTGQLRNVYYIMDDIYEVWDTLDKNTQEGIAFAAGGTRQKSVFLSTIENWENVRKATESAMNSTGSAAVENEKYLDSISGKIANFQSAFESLSNTIINSDLVKSVIEGGTGILNTIDNILGELGTLQTLLPVIGAGFSIFKNIGVFSTISSDATSSGKALAIFGKEWRDIVTDFQTADKGSNAVSSFFKGLNNAFGKKILSGADVDAIRNYNALIEKGVEPTMAIDDAMSGASDSARALAVSANGAAISEDVLAKRTKTLTTSQRVAATASKGLRIALNALANIGVMIAINAIISGISSLINAQQEAIDKANELASNLKEETDALEDYTEQVISYKKQLEDTNLTESEAFDIRNQLLDVQKQLVESYNLEADGLDLVNGKLDEQLLKIQNLGKQKFQEYKRENASVVNDLIDSFENTSLTLAGYRLKLDDSYLGDSEAYFEVSNFLDKFLEENGFKGIGLGNDPVTKIKDYLLQTDIYSANEMLTELFEATDALSRNTKLSESVTSYAKNVSEYISDVIDDFIKPTLDSEEIYKQHLMYESEYNNEYLETLEAQLNLRYTMETGTNQDILDAQEDFRKKYNNLIYQTSDDGNTAAKHVFENEFDIDEVEQAINIGNFIKAIDSDKEHLKDIITATFVELKDYTAEELKSMTDETAESLTGSEKMAYETLKNIADGYNLSFETLIDTLGELGYIVAEVKTTLEDQLSLLESFADSTKQLEDTISLLKTVKDEISSAGNISLSTIQKVIESYPSLEKSLNDYLLGIKSQEDLLLELESYYNTDLENFKVYLEQKSLLTTIESWQDKEANFVDRLAEQYKIDLQNVKTYAQAKSLILAEANNVLADGLSAFYDISTGQYTETFNKLISNSPSSPAIELIRSFVSDLSKFDVNVDFQTLTDSIESAFSDSSSSSESSSSSTDLYLEAFNKEYAELKHIRAMNEIDEQEYYMRLQNLNVKYFLGKQEYLDEYRQYEEEVYSGLLSNYSAVLDEYSDLLDSQVEKYETLSTAIQALTDEKISALEQEKQALEDEKEALEDSNTERERALELIQAQLDLANAQKKTVMVYRKGEGFVEVADEAAIKEANAALDDLKLEAKKAEIEEQISAIDEKITEAEEYADNIQNIRADYENEQAIENAKAEFGLTEEELTNLTGTQVERIGNAFVDALESQSDFANIKDKIGSLSFEDLLKFYNISGTSDNIRSGFEKLTTSSLISTPLTSGNTGNAVSYANTYNNGKTVSVNIEINGATDPKAVAEQVNDQLIKLFTKI